MYCLAPVPSYHSARASFSLFVALHAVCVAVAVAVACRAGRHPRALHFGSFWRRPVVMAHCIVAGFPSLVSPDTVPLARPCLCRCYLAHPPPRLRSWYARACLPAAAPARPLWGPLEVCSVVSNWIVARIQMARPWAVGECPGVPPASARARYSLMDCSCRLPAGLRGGGSRPAHWAARLGPRGRRGGGGGERGGRGGARGGAGRGPPHPRPPGTTG